MGQETLSSVRDLERKAILKVDVEAGGKAVVVTSESEILDSVRYLEGLALGSAVTIQEVEVPTAEQQ